MPIKYIPPNVRTCDYCGARTSIPEGLAPSETKRRLESIGWTYRDFIVLCPRCQREAEARREGRRRIPILGRFLG